MIKGLLCHECGTYTIMGRLQVSLCGSCYLWMAQGCDYTG